LKYKNATKVPIQKCNKDRQNGVQTATETTQKAIRQIKSKPVDNPSKPSVISKDLVMKILQQRIRG